MNLSFINKQKLTCRRPENLRVVRPALETCQGRSCRVRSTVGVISSGATDPKPAWGCSSVLVTGLTSLVTVQMTGALVKDISPPVESQVSSQIGCWPPESRWSWGGRVRGSWRRGQAKSEMRACRPQGTARPGPLLSGESWELTCPWPQLYNEVSRLVTPARSDETADSPEEERKKGEKKALGPLWRRMGYPAVTC